MKQTIFCTLEGDTFSPKKLVAQTNLILEDCIELGDILKLGKNRHQAADYGRANLFAPQSMDRHWIDNLADLVATHHQEMLRCGVEEITLWVILDIASMANWEVSAESMAIFGKLNIPLCLTVYAEPDSEE